MQRLVNERFAARISIQAVVAARNPLCGRRRTFNTPAIGLSGKSLTRRFKSRNIGRALERAFVPPLSWGGEKRRCNKLSEFNFNSRAFLLSSLCFLCFSLPADRLRKLGSFTHHGRCSNNNIIGHCNLRELRDDAIHPEIANI